MKTMELTVEDRLALHELPGIYGDAVDDRNWAALDQVFTEDAVFEVIGLVTMTGLAEIKRYMDQEGQHPLAHLMTNIHIEVNDTGVRLYSRGIAPISGGSVEGVGYPIHFGSYYDEVVKTPSGWRIRNRVFSAKRLDKRIAKVDLE
ncbi:MAG: nuclear transport factor 2 family protein [Gammaproteobacteria bacterium]|nr:nuclear transport factor 2 family protein [Gammaproteobacteria bacterium]